MQSIEQRREARFTPADQIHWKLLVLAHGESLPVQSIRDISNSGISLVCSDDALDSDNITLEYRSKVIDFRVEGAVIWKSRETDNAGHTQNVLGLQMPCPALLMEAMQGSHG